MIAREQPERLAPGFSYWSLSLTGLRKRRRAYALRQFGVRRLVVAFPASRYRTTSMTISASNAAVFGTCQVFGNSIDGIGNFDPLKPGKTERAGRKVRETTVLNTPGPRDRSSSSRYSKSKREAQPKKETVRLTVYR